MSECSGYGKVILFGEHFVVDYMPGIAAAISLKTTGTVTSHDGVHMRVGAVGDTVEIGPGNRLDSIATTMSNVGMVIEDRRIAIKDYKLKKMPHARDALKNMLAKMEIDAMSPVQVTVGGDLLCASGVGASAAWCVAIARALSERFGKNFTDDEINDIAYEGERAYAGTPSGIDNAVATFGGLLWYKKAKEKGKKSEITPLKFEKPVEIVMGNSGVVANTKEMVAGVKDRRKKNPDKYDNIFKEYGALVQEARAAVEAYDLQEVGRLMDKNHEMLQGIEVSHPKLEELVAIARENGALGAKMTGGGGGGYMVALTPGKELQNEVASAMEARGFVALRTVIGF